MKISHRLGLLAALPLVVSGATFAADILSQTLESVDSTVEAKRQPDITSVVARVEMASGHLFEFVDEGDTIRVAEIAPAGSQSNLEELIA